MKYLGKGDSRHRIDRIRRIEQRWRQASAKLQSYLHQFLVGGAIAHRGPSLANRLDKAPLLDLPQVRAALLRQDRLMRLVLGAYGRDIGWIHSAEGRAAASRTDLALIAEKLAHLDHKAAALRDSVVRVLAMNAELELQLKQERNQSLRLDQARLAALTWSDTLRAELDRKSEALRQAHEALEARSVDGPAASTNAQPV